MIYYFGNPPVAVQRLWPAADFPVTLRRPQIRRQNNLTIWGDQEVDVGCLRDGAGLFSLDVATASGRWEPWTGSYDTVRGFYRWGPGSYGFPGTHNTHNTPWSKYNELSQVDPLGFPPLREIHQEPIPGSRPLQDLDYDQGFLSSTLRAWDERFGTTPEPQPEPPPPPPVIPPQPPPPPAQTALPPLSPPEVRVEELRAIFRKAAELAPAGGNFVERFVYSAAAFVADEKSWSVLRLYGIQAIVLFRRARKALGDPRPLP